MAAQQPSGKDRITITLRKDLLPLLDRFVDGDKIRNRSHAIEFILGQHLGLGIQKAVILAGGEDGAVQALTRVRNRPVIAYTFDMLKENGIRDVVLVVGEQSSELREYIGDGVQWGLNVEFVEDPSAAGTGSALALVRDKIDHTFLLIYSDVLIDLNLSDFLEYHQQCAGTATVALTYKEQAGSFGVARMEGAKVVSFEEKPGAKGEHGLVNAGVYLLEADFFSHITDDTQSLEDAVLPQLASQGGLCGYPFQGKWFDISEPESRDSAEQRWR